MSCTVVGARPSGRFRLQHRDGIESSSGVNVAFRIPDQSIAVLVTKAIRLLSGDHEGTLIVPCPP